MFKINTETTFHGGFGLRKLIIQAVRPRLQILCVGQKFVDVVKVALESRCFLIKLIQLRNLEK